MLLRDLGRLAEAEPLFLEALEASRRTLGDEHPDTLKSISNVASILRQRVNQGHRGSSAKIRRRILRSPMDSGGPRGGRQPT